MVEAKQSYAERMKAARAQARAERDRAVTISSALRRWAVCSARRRSMRALGLKSAQ
jgi:hypothetical protein